MTFDSEELLKRLQTKDASLFTGETASNSLGWIDHPERYLGSWIDEVVAQLPTDTGRTILLGMGGSSSPARFYAESTQNDSLHVLDTSSPDSISETDFSHAVAIASSKSGSTIETQTLLAHALANGLTSDNLIVITDPGSALVELGHSLGALVIEGDPTTGGRFSAISPFGLIPALYAGWSPTALREEHAVFPFDSQLVAKANDLATALTSETGLLKFELTSDPLSSGSALWLEQLIAETTGKDGRGLVPVWNGQRQPLKPREMMYWQLVASLCARQLGVDPFNQPNVEIAKKSVLSLLANTNIQPDLSGSRDEVKESFKSAAFREVNVYCAIEDHSSVAQLRAAIANCFGATAANIGPRYLHSTGQLFKGGPREITTLQVVVRPRSTPQRIAGRQYSFHDLFFAQANGDLQAMKSSQRSVFQVAVDDLSEVFEFLDLSS